MREKMRHRLVNIVLRGVSNKKVKRSCVVLLSWVSGRNMRSLGMRFSLLCSLSLTSFINLCEKFSNFNFSFDMLTYYRPIIICRLKNLTRSYYELGTNKVPADFLRTSQIRLDTVRLTSIHYRVSGNQIFCFAPTETIDGRVKKIRSPTCGMV
jgi:hypothetical protein